MEVRCGNSDSQSVVAINVTIAYGDSWNHGFADYAMHQLRQSDRREDLESGTLTVNDRWLKVHETMHTLEIPIVLRLDGELVRVAGLP